MGADDGLIVGTSVMGVSVGALVTGVGAAVGDVGAGVGEVVGVLDGLFRPKLSFPERTRGVQNELIQIKWYKHNIYGIGESESKMERVNFEVLYADLDGVYTTKNR